MASLNKVQIIGRLGNDVDMRYTASGSAVANVTVATSEKWKVRTVKAKSVLLGTI